MASPWGTLLDPSLEQLTLLGSNGLACRWWWHDEVWILAFNPVNDLTSLDRSGMNRLLSFPRELCRILLIQSQIGLPMRFVRTMAVEAVFRKDRSDLQPKVDAFRLVCGLCKQPGRKQCGLENQPECCNAKSPQGAKCDLKLHVLDTVFCVFCVSMMKCRRD